MRELLRELSAVMRVAFWPRWYWLCRKICARTSATVTVEGRAAHP